MRWLCAAVATWAALGAAVAWIGLRDWTRYDGAEQRQLALRHAAVLLPPARGPHGCPSCMADVVRPLRTHVWMVRLYLPGRPICRVIDNDRFAVLAAGRVAGVRRVACPR